MSSETFKPLTCFYWRKDGHMISNCPEKLKMARQQHDAESKPTGFVPTSLSLPDFNGDRPAKVPDAKTQLSLISEVSAPPEPGINVFEPFIREGSISLSSDMSKPHINQDFKRYWSLAVLSLERHLVVLGGLVCWCECPYQGNQSF